MKGFWSSNWEVPLWCSWLSLAWCCTMSVQVCWCPLGSHVDPFWCLFVTFLWDRKQSQLALLSVPPSGGFSGPILGTLGLLCGPRCPLLVSWGTFEVARGGLVAPQRPPNDAQKRYSHECHAFGTNRRPIWLQLAPNLARQGKAHFRSLPYRHSKVRLCRGEPLCTALTWDG